MKANGKAIGTAGLLGICALAVAAIFSPSAIIVVAGMVPTLAAALGARQYRALKTFTIGALNFAGCVPFLIELWASGQTVRHALDLIENPRTLIVIYCAAGVGYLIDWGVGTMVGLIMTQRMQSRLQDVRAEQAKLIERWGQEVTGEATIESEGTSSETKRPVGQERR